jgi:hypothetical protein
MEAVGGHLRGTACRLRPGSMGVRSRAERKQASTHKKVYAAKKRSHPE